MKTSALIAVLATLTGCSTQLHPGDFQQDAGGGAIAADDFARRGRALAEAGRPEAALRALNEALRLNPQHAKAVYDRAVIHHAAGRSAEAMADIDRAVLLDPQNTRARSARCVIQVTAEANSAGLRNCYFAMQMSGPAAEPQTALGQALLMLGRPREALAAFDDALRADPAYAEARYGRGIARQLTGDAAGRADVQEAVKESPAAGRTFAAASTP